MNDVTLRPATLADVDTLFAIRRAAMKLYVEQTWGPWDEQWQASYFRDHFRPEQSWVIQHDNKDVGLWQVEHREDCVFLTNIEILPEYQRRGIGTHLIRNLLDEASDKNLPLRLQVLKVNPAKQLYERLGLHLTGQTETHFLMSSDRT
jgi:ribosomal protein S18 acetylase RimI-like enzyme